MCSTGWRVAAGETTRTFGGWTRATPPQATVPGWGKSTPKISTRSPSFHSNAPAGNVQERAHGLHAALKILAEHIAQQLKERGFCLVFNDDLERCWPSSEI